jgi:hypothetical protein
VSACVRQPMAARPRPTAPPPSATAFETEEEALNVVKELKVAGAPRRIMELCEVRRLLKPAWNLVVTLLRWLHALAPPKGGVGILLWERVA